MLTLGPPEAEEQLRDAMAIGADRAILLETDGGEWDPEATAAALVEVIAAENPDLVIFGNESADAGGFQVGIRVAHALGRPIVTGLKAIAVEDGALRCEQEVGSARDVYRVPLPAVVTVKEGINLPRYPSVPAKLRARRKPVDRRTPTAPAPRLEMVRLVVPEGKGKQAEVLGEGPGAAPCGGRAAAEAGGRVSTLVFLEAADDLGLQALDVRAPPRPCGRGRRRRRRAAGRRPRSTSRRSTATPRRRGRARSPRSTPPRSSPPGPTAATRCSRTRP